MPNKAVNRTPKACRFWFPPLGSGASYLQRYAAVQSHKLPSTMSTQGNYGIHQKEL